MRPEAVKIFDLGPYPYLLLPRASEPLVLPATLSSSEADISCLSTDELMSMRTEVTKLLDKAQRSKTMLDPQIEERLPKEFRFSMECLTRTKRSE